MRGFPRLYASLVLGRISGQMLSVALVLFILSRYHSPQLAGAAVFLVTFPGLLLSPIAGAVLDRYRRARLMALDYAVAALMLLLLAWLSLAHSLAPPVLLLICGVSSLTGPLSAAGARAIFPSVVPGHLWERGNALDSTSHVLASIIGAPLAGLLVAFAGGECALAATGALFARAGITIFGVIVAAAMVATAVVETPWDISFLTLRQRRTDPSKFGRAFAVSVSLNIIGTPIGSALAGPLIAWSLDYALWFAVVMTALAAVLSVVTIPAKDK